MGERGIEKEKERGREGRERGRERQRFGLMKKLKHAHVYISSFLSKYKQTSNV